MTLALSSGAWAGVSRTWRTASLSRTEASQLLGRIVSACLAHATPGDAGLRLGESSALFDDRAAGLEGISRLLWGVVPALQGGFRPEGVAQLRRGIVNGTDPSSPAYWHPAPAWGNQRHVEMAAIALAIHDAPAQFLGPLSPAERENLFNWLAGIAQSELPPNNWRWFRILTLEALARAGRPVDRSIINADHELLESLRLERGWYRDGVDGGVDYYNGLAFHFYGLLFALWRGQEEPERARRLIEDARTFAEDYRLWFTDDGQQLVYGRSLTYRFASVGFWGLLARFGHPCIGMGQLRGLWSRAIRFWVAQPIWSEPWVPSVGYRYPNLLMQEFYNSPQSPLWMMKAFWPLALPATHPFWTSPELDDQAGAAGYILSSAPQMLKRHHGDPCLIPGSINEGELRSYEDKYAKFAYTARHGFSVEGTRWLAQGFAGDNLLAISVDGRSWHARTQIEHGAIEGEWMVTRWRTPDAEVQSRQRFTDAGEERQHLIRAKRPIKLVATGHAVDRTGGAQPLDRISAPASSDRPVAQGSRLWSDLRCDRTDFVRAVLPCAPNTNLNFPAASVPALIGQLEPGESGLLTRLAWGAGTPPARSPAVN